MSERHWVMAVNEQTDECRFMQLYEEWLPFKYNNTEDIQPSWTQIGFYETQHDAFSAFMGLAGNSFDQNPEGLPDINQGIS